MLYFQIITYITYIYLLAKLIPFYTKINEMNYLIN